MISATQSSQAKDVVEPDDMAGEWELLSDEFKVI